jgi:hypothetical protein
MNLPHMRIYSLTIGTVFLSISRRVSISRQNEAIPTAMPRRMQRGGGWPAGSEEQRFQSAKNGNKPARRADGAHSAKKPG